MTEGRRFRRVFTAIVVALGGPGLVTLLHFTSLRAVVPALLYAAAIILATAVGGRIAGLVAVAASAYPFFHFFANRYDRSSANAEGVTATVVFVLTALFASEVLRRERVARERAEEAVRVSRIALDAASRLQSAADALATARTPHEVLDAVLREGVRAAEARSGLIATLSEDGEWLEVTAARGYDEKSMAPYQRFALDGNFPLSEAVRTGEGVFISSGSEQDTRYPDLVGMQPRHALVCLPLVGHAGPIGGLVFSFASDQEFPPERRALKLALARQAGLALERSLIAEKEERLRERLAFLDAATALLTSSLDLREMLGWLTSLAVPELADWCSISVLSEDLGLIEPLAVAHHDPKRRRWAEEMQTRTRPIHIDDEFDLTARVLRTGEPVLLREVPQELLDAAAERDPEAARALEEITIRSAITVPLISGSRRLGVLTLVAEEREFGDDDFELAQQLAARAAVALDNARLYAEAERRAEASLALAYVGDGVILLDDDGKVRFWNPAAAAITGLRSTEAVGHRLSAVLPAWEEVTRRIEFASSEAVPARARPITVPVETPAGDRWISVTAVNFGDGVVYALRDVTDEQALERARSDFVATASHELRTPLAAVYGSARTLRRADIELSPEQRDRFLEIIESETERLTAIVSQILLAGQLEEGRVDLSSSATDLRGLAESVLDSTRVRAPADVELQLDVGIGDAVALADEDKLRQVLVNLLDNAVKYSPDGGRVTVELGKAPGLVTLTVRDDGLGIPPNEQDRIFEKFYRLDPALTRGVGGSGLGLYISRELVSRMGGRMSVRSRLGEGAAFTVELPAA